MKIIYCGDSWTWGAELFPPSEINPLSINKNELYFTPEYMEYRLSNKYTTKLTEKLNFTESVDLSRQSISNDAIHRKLVEYLATEGYLSGRDTSDLFVSIGWTSPERTEFFFKEKWGEDNYVEVGPWSLEMSHYTQCPQDVKTFLRLYCENFWEPGGFLHRYILTLYQTQMLLKTHNIKYVMHQAFYHHFLPPLMPNDWDDVKYKEKFDTITLGDKRLWSLLDEKRFMYLNHPDTGTFHHFIINAVGGDPRKVLEGWHPNSLGHQIWADEMYKYITENQLL
jgi:hypothetical protein